MAWQTPKTDWASNDVTALTDMNRWEGNALSNHRRFEVSSNIHTAATINAGQVQNNQRIYFSVEDDEKIVIKNARYRLNSAGLKLRVWYDIGGGSVVAFTSASHEGDEEPDQTIYSNTTGSPVTGYYCIQAQNPTGGGLTVSLLDGYSLTLEKEDV